MLDNLSSFPVDGGCVPEQNRGIPWFDDGNIILLAENVAFKVYRGLLSHHSIVFADLFAPPLPETGTEMMEDCPVVTLHDSVHDLANFLEAIHDGYSR